jgi:hypothetical protein
VFKIIGADQKEYGPVSVEELRKWMAEGRANGQTLVQTEGGPWKPLASFPDLAADLPPAPPSSAPPPPGSPPTLIPSSSADAARAVSAPAVCLIVSTILGMLLGILNSATGIVFNLVGGQSPGWNLPKDPEFARLERVIEMFSGTLGMVSELISLALGAFILVGAFRMMKLRSYGLAVAASSIAMIPCVSPCCCLGLPFGIWALVVLSRREVKSAFQ